MDWTTYQSHEAKEEKSHVFFISLIKCKVLVSSRSGEWQIRPASNATVFNSSHSGEQYSHESWRSIWQHLHYLNSFSNSPRNLSSTVIFYQIMFLPGQSPKAELNNNSKIAQYLREEYYVYDFFLNISSFCIFRSIVCVLHISRVSQDGERTGVSEIILIVHNKQKID